MEPSHLESKKKHILLVAAHSKTIIFVLYIFFVQFKTPLSVRFLSYFSVSLCCIFGPLSFAYSLRSFVLMKWLNTRLIIMKNRAFHSNLRFLFSLSIVFLYFNYWNTFIRKLDAHQCHIVIFLFVNFPMSQLYLFPFVC